MSTTFQWRTQEGGQQGFTGGDTAHEQIEENRGNPIYNRGCAPFRLGQGPMFTSVLISAHDPDLIYLRKPEGAVMPPNPELPTTSVLFIDGNAAERGYFAEGLRRCSSDYLILEATDGESGLDLYRRSQRIDCVVLELDLPDQSGFEVLLTLVPIASRPNVAVIVLTRLTHRGVWELAKQNGAIACFVKRHMGGEDLDRAIQHAVALVGLLPKEDRYRPASLSPRNK